MFARRPLLAAATAVPVLIGACAPTASAVTHRHATPAAHVKQAPTRTKPTAPRAKAPAATPAKQSTASYTNWAGYQMAVSAPTSARATWKVPAVKWAGRDGYSNQWVGIGGGNAGQGQLIQAGTESDSVCTRAVKGHCTASKASYFLWFETYPQQTQERITNLAISPGDTVSVEVGYRAKGSTATFELCNTTRHACVTATRPSPAPRAVAEYVVERPTDGSGRQLALANYGTTQFTGLQIKSGAQALRMTSLPTTRMFMNNGHPLATTGPLNASRTQFSTTHQRPA